MKKKNTPCLSATEKEYEYVVQGVRLTLMLIEAHDAPKPSDSVTRDQFHRHTWYELFFVERGNMTLLFENGNISLQNGRFALVAPGVLHYADEKPTDGERLVCNFSVQYPAKSKQEKLFSSFLESAPCLVFGSDALCTALMHQVMLSMASGQGDAAGSYLASLLFRAAALCATTATYGHASPDSQLGRVYKIEQNLYSHHTDAVSFSSLAEHMHISERQLSRVFKKQYGMSYRTKKLELRMQSAARRLLRGETAAEIAAAIGYNSQSAFYAAFKAYFGLSPAQYKKCKGGCDLEEKNHSKQ